MLLISSDLLISTIRLMPKKIAHDLSIEAKSLLNIMLDEINVESDSDSNINYYLFQC